MSISSSFLINRFFKSKKSINPFGLKSKFFDIKDIISFSSILLVPKVSMVIEVGSATPIA